MKVRKKHLWGSYKTWNAAEAAWDKRAQVLESTYPLKGIKHWRTLPGIRPSTQKHLRFKALKYLVQHDQNGVLGYFWRKPIRHLYGMIRSYLQKKPYVRDGDFFLYGFKDVEAFQANLKREDSLFLIGFSYCHKPFECPSGRFTDECIHDLENPVCGQCFIGKCVHALPEKKTVPVIIPTVHYIAEKIIEAMDANPDKHVLFLITACELTLEMFGDWGNMIDVRGIGVRLDGQICNTMQAFEASEKGIKPGLAVVLNGTQKRLLNLISLWRHHTAVEYRDRL